MWYLKGDYMAPEWCSCGTWRVQEYRLISEYKGTTI